MASNEKYVNFRGGASYYVKMKYYGGKLLFSFLITYSDELLTVVVVFILRLSFLSGSGGFI